MPRYVSIAPGMQIDLDAIMKGAESKKQALESPVTPAPVGTEPIGNIKDWLWNQDFYKNNQDFYNKYSDEQLSDMFSGKYDEYLSGSQKAETSSNYNQALGALTPAMNADVGEYQRVSPFAQRKLLGGLAGRGLGTSVMAGGSGSGAMSELANRQQAGLFGIQSGYQDLANQLEKQKAGEDIDLDAFFSNLSSRRNYARQMAQQQQTDVWDILGVVPNAVGAILK